MDREQGEKLLNEMQAFLSDDNSNVSADDAMLPFETLDDFSTAPVEFNEMAKTMLTRVEAVFDKAVKYNRHSKQYIKTAVQLEKGIKFLASCCLTKIALKMNKTDCPELGQLSTEKLYRMASFHYRKINAALDEYQTKNNDLDDVLLEMQYRYFNLLGRLRSTEVRIYKYQDKRIFGTEDETPIVHGRAFSEKSWTREIHKQYSEPASFHQPASFSPLAPVVLNPENPVADQPKTLPTPKQPVIADQQTSQEDVSLAVSENQKDETKVSSEVEAGSAFNPATENNVNPEPASIEDDDDCNLITEAPSWREIMGRVYQRSAGAEDGSISLTISEIGSLLCDDDFLREKPELAEQFYRILAEYDVGEEDGT